MTPRPWTLRAAAALAACETAVIIAILGVGGEPGAPMYIAFLAVKFPFCWFLVRRSPAAYLGLFVWELAGAVAALGANGTGVALRLLEVAVAAAVVGLLVASTPLFPAVRLPSLPES